MKLFKVMDPENGKLYSGSLSFGAGVYSTEGKIFSTIDLANEFIDAFVSFRSSFPISTNYNYKFCVQEFNIVLDTVHEEKSVNEKMIDYFNKEDPSTDNYQLRLNLYLKYIALNGFLGDDKSIDFITNPPNEMCSIAIDCFIPIQMQDNINLFIDNGIKKMSNFDLAGVYLTSTEEQLTMYPRLSALYK